MPIHAVSDGHVVKANGRGVVKTKIESSRSHLPTLSYNSVSVPNATKSVKTAKCDEDGCQILDEALANLYFLSSVDCHHANPAVESSSVGSEEVT